MAKPAKKMTKKDYADKKNDKQMDKKMANMKNGGKKK